MKVTLSEFRWVDILVDQEKNIVVFPISQSSERSYNEFLYYPAYHPIELMSPYSVQELAQKIELGIDEWNKYECYENPIGKNTLEERYYGIKGFKNATKGKKLIRLGWDDIQGKYVSFSMPCKRGYAYLGLKNFKLPEEADWLDYAQCVIDIINMDLSQLKYYRLNKSTLNI